MQYDTLLASHDLAGGGRSGWTQVGAGAKACGWDGTARVSKPTPALHWFTASALADPPTCNPLQADLQAVAARLPRCQELSRMTAAGAQDGDPGAEYAVEGEAEEEEDEYE